MDVLTFLNSEKKCNLQKTFPLSSFRSRQLAAFMGHQQQVAAALQAHQQLQANASSNSTSSTNTTASSSSSNNTNSVGTTVSSSTQPPLVTSPTNNNLISTTTTTSSANNSPSSLVNHSHFVASSHTDIFEVRHQIISFFDNAPKYVPSSWLRDAIAGNEYYL